MQAEAKSCAAAFNKLNPPHRVEFLDAWLVEFKHNGHTITSLSCFFGKRGGGRERRDSGLSSDHTVRDKQRRERRERERRGRERERREREREEREERKTEIVCVRVCVRLYVCV